MKLRAKILHWCGCVSLALCFALMGCDAAQQAPGGANPGGGAGTTTLPGSVEQVRKCEDAALCARKCKGDNTKCIEQCNGKLSQAQQAQMLSLALCAERGACDDSACLRTKCGDSLTACSNATGGTSGSGGGGGTRPPGPVEPPIRCRSQDDCDEDESCERGVCVGESRPGRPPQPGGERCRDHDDCDEGERCFRGTCSRSPQPPTPTERCQENKDCKDNAVCFQGRCRELPPGSSGTACKSRTDCKDGEVCGAGKCIKLPAPPDDRCRSDRDCDDDERCERGQCREGGRRCRSDRDCSDGERCRDNTCSKAP